MNKYLLVTGVLGVILIGVWTLGKITGALESFKTVSYANYPTFKNGDRLFASNLKKPKRFDFICYENTSPVLGKEIWFHRLVGLPKDKIEIRNGILLVNDKVVDDSLSLAHNYYVLFNDVYNLKEIEKNDDDLNMQVYSDDTVVMYLSDENVVKHKLNVKRLVLPKGYKDDLITSVFGKPWNQDNFGPVMVPAEKYFVLGDNRSFSQDSRYIGFIDEKNYRGTLIK